MSIKSADPFATPIASIAGGVRPSAPESLPSMATKRQHSIPEKPNYQQLVSEMQSEPPEQPAFVEESVDFAPPVPIQPRRVETIEPVAEPYPPPRTVMPAATPPPPPPPAAPVEKPGLVEANKNLIVLFAITFLAIKFAAPKLRAYPRFVSNSELGLNIVGIVAVSVLIVTVYKLTVHMANLKQ